MKRRSLRSQIVGVKHRKDGLYAERAERANREVQIRPLFLNRTKYTVPEGVPDKDGQMEAFNNGIFHETQLRPERHKRFDRSFY